MDRRIILEKLGLIEKIEGEDGEPGQDAENTEQSPADAEKLISTDNMKESGVNTKVKEKLIAEAKTPDESYDPVAIVRKKKLLGINDIYKNYDINTEGINSLAIVESFQKALPDYLPMDVKRQSILNIIASSNVRIESLLNDGEDKLRCLKDFSESFSNESNEVISGFENEIKKLNEKINNFKTAISDMKKLQTEQVFTLKYEIEKTNNILQFINPEN